MINVYTCIVEFLCLCVCISVHEKQRVEVGFGGEGLRVQNQLI